MIQGTEKIFLMGQKSPIRAALVRRLLQLGHPRSHLLMRSIEAPIWVKQDQARQFMTEEQPDLVYLIDSPGSDMAHPTDPALSRPSGRTLPPSSVIQAAADAGVKRLMYVATAAVHLTNEPLNQTHDACLQAPPGPAGRCNQADALRLCALLADQGLDYRSTTACEAYGPYWPESPPARMAPAAALIEGLFRQFSDALNRGADQVTVRANPGELVELMFVTDMAEAIVHVTELPAGLLTGATQPPSLHIDLGTERDVQVAELVDAAAVAAGFRGRVLFQPGPSIQEVHRLNSRHLARLGWRPLITLDTGLELTAMDFRLRQISRRVAEQYRSASVSALH